MKSCISDLASFFKHVEDSLAGKCSTYDDDTLKAGIKEYQELTKLTEENFICKYRK